TSSDGATAAASELVLHHRLADERNAEGYGGGWEETLASLAQLLHPNLDQGTTLTEALAVETWTTLRRAPLQLDQLVNAPIQQVWHALASAEGLKKWWWRHWDDVQISADVREGGSYRIEVPSMQIELTGTYLAVDEPHRLAYTWV
ncbi:hypothetical protein GQM37_23240, partial [Escherichia coli]|uniref:SRPBCC family protein n=1 Tax=Escherichia coli TaxID=562 RepID=UPI0013653FD3